MALLLLLGYSIILVYRSGRPDCLCILLYSLAFMAVVCLRSPARGWVVFASALLMPWAGLQCLPTLAILGCFLIFLDWRAHTRLVVLAGFGAVCGLGCLLCFYQYHGALGDFHRAIVPQAVGQGVIASLLHGTFSHHNRLPGDFSFCVLFGGAFLSEVVGWRRGRVQLRSTLMMGILFCVVLSVVLLLSGKFPTYYAWTTYLPLAAAVVCELANGLGDPLKRKMLAATCGLTILVGASLHVCAAWYDWPYRDPSIVENLVSRNVRQGDVAYGDPAVYYALRDHGLLPQIGRYIEAMEPWEKERVSIIFETPSKFPATALALGGEWRQVDEFKPPRMGFLGTSWDLGFISELNYHLAVYRRAGTNSPAPDAR
jgi:hypothetical protein